MRGEPRPPAPMTSTRAFLSLCCPGPPISCSTMGRAKRSISPAENPAMSSDPRAALPKESCNRRAQLAYSFAGARGRGDHLGEGSRAGRSNGKRRCELRLLPGGFHFISLGQNDLIGDGARVQEIEHADVRGLCAMAAVDQEKDSQQGRASAQITAYQAAPACGLFLAHGRIAIARHIGETKFYLAGLAKLEEIQPARAAWRA